MATEEKRPDDKPKASQLPSQTTPPRREGAPPVASQQPVRKPREGGEGEEERLGNPMREDDLINQFRAPDVKATGTIFAEDIIQFVPEEIALRTETVWAEEIPEETHPQVPRGGDGGWAVQQGVGEPAPPQPKRSA
jgi:hypothetical protein